MPAQQNNRLDMATIENTVSYRQLIREKKRFVILASSLLLAVLLLLPFLTSFTNVLNAELRKGINLAIAYAYFVFLLPILIVQLYAFRAQRYDKLADEAKTQARGE